MASVWASWSEVADTKLRTGRDVSQLIAALADAVAAGQVHAGDPIYNKVATLSSSWKERADAWYATPGGAQEAYELIDTQTYQLALELAKSTGKGSSVSEPPQVAEARKLPWWAWPLIIAGVLGAFWVYRSTEK